MSLSIAIIGTFDIDYTRRCSQACLHYYQRVFQYLMSATL